VTRITIRNESIQALNQPTNQPTNQPSLTLRLPHASELVEAGLASAIAECLPVWRGTPGEVTRMRITDAGRRLILGHG
jgi:hypothetical protein